MLVFTLAVSLGKGTDIIGTPRENKAHETNNCADFSQPWGVALTPENFGSFSDVVLVRQTANGWIRAYSKTNGAFKNFCKVVVRI